MKIGLLNLGCPKNLVDGEVMLGLAEQGGHEITSDAHQADVLVVNTCAFIDRAKQESIDAILEMAEIKKQAPGRRLVVAGCLAERYRTELAQEIPEIDALLGTGEVPRIVEVLAVTRNGEPATGIGRTPAGSSLPPTGCKAQRAARIDQMTFYRRDRLPEAGSSRPAGAAPVFGVDLPTYIYDADTPRRLTTPKHYAYVKVAEGCDYKCAFCVIPKMRGRYRSRPAASIVAEARTLADRGVKELLLVSQDTTFYGVDRGERGALARLLRDLDQVDGLTWIRLLYLYPTTVTDDVIDAIAGSSKVCKYIDLPLQHASDRVLRRMKRPGSRAAYDRLLARIRRGIPGVALRTTFIVGFPGESQQDVNELTAFVGDVGFDHVGVFTYSHEEDTAAYGYEDDVSAEVKEERRASIMTLQRSLVARRHRARRGDRTRLLVDGPAPEHEWVMRGRLEGQAPEIDPMVYLTECDPRGLAPGELVDVEITGARGYDLVARVV